MYTTMISVALGLVTFGVLWGTDVFGWGWSIFFGVLGFVVGQVVMGNIFRKKTMAVMHEVEGVLKGGQKRLEAEMRQWQVRPPDSITSAQKIMERRQKVFLEDALARTEKLRPYEKWVPLMRRQIATAQLNLYWMLKDFSHVDRLMGDALMLDPMMASIKLARMYMRHEPTEAMAKVYRKAVKRVRYNQNVLPAATWSWIQLQQGDADGAYATLTEALKHSDDATLKANHGHLANNKTAHFSNAGLGDRWYALFLEEPKVRMQRPRQQWR